MIAFILGACGAVSSTRMPSALNTSLNVAVDLRSRSLIKYRKWPTRSPRSSMRFRGCWATHSRVGFAVTPMTWTRRERCSTTAKQYSLVSVIVSTWKKSAARIPDAWVFRNCSQVGSPRRGAGSIPAFFRVAHTVAGETLRPRPAISPAMGLYPQVGFSLAMRKTRVRIVGLVGGRPGVRLG
jgi:hypothetical protein